MSPLRTLLLLGYGALSCNGTMLDRTANIDGFGGSRSGTGPSSSDASSAGGAGASGGDGSAGSSRCGDHAAGLPFDGHIELSFLPDSSVPFWVQGGFSQSRSGAVSCNGTALGSCCYHRLVRPGLPIPGDDPPPSQLTVRDGSNVLASIEGSLDYLKTSQFAESLHWAPGDALGIAITGGPADGLRAAVVAPPALAELVPSFSDPMNVSPSSDFVLSWTPGNDACARVVLRLSDATEADITCSVDDFAGTLTVPRALLGMFTNASGAMRIDHVRFSFAHTSSASVELDAVTGRLGTANYAR